ncbi:flavin reductase family protein [Planctomicrobium sp. SH661]|uniref:flavin reductase family protein n=1 Tax=Planctomicrobium sp. SH661 TaxID=3448124 RepID=UPI003F5AFB22
MNDSIPQVLGQIPSGLSILSARNAEGAETGMLASWVQQAAFSPPAITLAVNKSRYLHSWLQTGISVAISLVGDTQKQLLGHFGKGFEPGAPAFEGLKIERTPAGLPVLAESLGWLEGTVSDSMDAGDHAVFLVQLTNSGAGPLLGKERPWVHVRKNGLHY